MKVYELPLWKRKLRKIMGLCYADDTTVIPENEKTLQLNLNTLNKEFRKINMKTNIEKVKKNDRLCRH